MTTTAAIRSGRLTDEHVEHYTREGYLKFEDQVLERDEFDALKQHFEDKLSRLPADVRPESMDVPHFTDTALFRWLFNDQVLDLVESVLGPDIALFSSHFLCKPRGNGKRVPWHEDSYYWRGMMDPMEVCTVWLAIDPSVRENGCMKVVPRTHHNGYSEYEVCDASKNVFDSEIKRTQFDESRAVYLTLDPGQCSLHDARLIHGSDANNSTLRRCGYTMRYISTRTKFNTEKFGQWHNIYLARGTDHAGNVYADPTHSYDHMARYRELHKKNGH